MLIRTKQILQPYITLLKASVGSDRFGKHLTRKIMQIRNNHDLLQILTRYQASFNIMNLTAILKKLNRDALKDQLIQSKILKELNQIWDRIAPEPNSLTTRTIANVIGYLGSLNYHGMDTKFQKLDYRELFKHTKSKQFVMVVTGLLKLDIYHKCINVSVKKLLLMKVDHHFNIGQLISLWRNAIKFRESDDELNIFVSNLISSKAASHNLKDYGYLTYCYIITYKRLKESDKICRILQKYPQSILHSNRANIFEICILLDHLSKFRQIHPETKFSPQFNYLLEQHYLKNIRILKELRSLANGYYSLINYFKQPSHEIYINTAARFIKILAQVSQTDDYQSITSMFVHLQAFPEADDIQEYESKVKLEGVFHAVTNYLFESGNPKITDLENRQFQKLCYGLNLYGSNNQELEINERIRHCLIEETQRRQFTDLQLVSLVPIYINLGIRSIGLCRYFNTNLKKADRQLINKYKLSDKMVNNCILGKNTDCLNCFECII